MVPGNLSLWLGAWVCAMGRRRQQQRCHAGEQGDVSDELVCWKFSRGRCDDDSISCGRLHVVGSDGVAVCGNHLGRFLGYRSRGSCAECTLAHPEAVGPCIRASIADAAAAGALQGNVVLQEDGERAASLVPSGHTAHASPLPCMVALDFGYDDMMSARELASLATQSSIAHHLCKQHAEHASLELVGLTGAAAQALDAAGVRSWNLRQHADLEALLRDQHGPLDARGIRRGSEQQPCADRRRRSIVYLSPDAEQELESLEEGVVHVIGGERHARAHASGAAPHVRPHMYTLPRVLSASAAPMPCAGSIARRAWHHTLQHDMT